MNFNFFHHHEAPALLQNRRNLHTSIRVRRSEPIDRPLVREFRNLTVKHTGIVRR